MKRIFFLLLVLLTMTNNVSAQNEEKQKIGNYYFKIEEDYFAYSVDGLEYKKINEIDNVHLKSLMPVYGNGRYIIINSENPDKMLSSHYLLGKDSGPLYIFDENLELIETFEFNGTVFDCYFDGYNFIVDVMYKENPALMNNSSHPACSLVYETFDGTDWVLKERDGYENKFNIENCDYIEIVDKPEELFKQEYIPLDLKNIKELPIADEMDAYRVNTDFLGYFHKVKYKNYDGLKYVHLPADANTGEIRADGEYVYITIDVFDWKCYRIPISEFISDVKIILNDEYLSFEYAPVVEQDRILVPLRFLFEKMDAEVTWMSETKQVKVTKNDNSVLFTIDDERTFVNGIERKMDVSARLINDKTYIPLRFLAEGLGYSVEWDEESGTAKIMSEQ